MRPNYVSRLILAAILLFGAAIWISCSKSTKAAEPHAASDAGKVPITTKSEDARKEFLLGRDLSDRLLFQDSLQHFDKAIALDPEFASAELLRANFAPTAKEFFEHTQKSVSLADKASEGEKLLILANEAGANGKLAEQKQYLDKAVAAYPNDERVRVLLGFYYFGRQDYQPAIVELKKANEIAPNYSPAYNQLGYTYRQVGDYSNAEQAFKKYIELIPNDPNPYDSYAELLLKMGRFDDSITQYRKALAVDPHFAPSRAGIAADLMYSGKAAAAQEELQKLADQARNDGESRNAFFNMAVLATDSGKLDKAVQDIDKEYAIAEKKNDTTAMAGDLRNKGNLLTEMQRYDAAAQQYARALQLVQASSLSQGVKDNAARQHLFDISTLAIAKRDLASARKNAAEFRNGAEAANNPGQIKQAHELAGMIAMSEKNYDNAVAELGQANQEDPRNLYRLGQAYQGKGDSAKAKELWRRAADFNSLPQLNYAIIRTKAQKAAGAKAA